MQEAHDPRALRGFSASGERVAALLWSSDDGGHLLACRYHPARGFVWVRREDLAGREEPLAGTRFEGVTLERTPLKPLLEELAHAVVAHKRAGAPLPTELQVLVGLLSPGGEETLI